MITGFNTDIKHAQRVYHVQTEDRGLANPIVESLVYVGGEILLSKKSPYQDLISGDRVDEKALRQMMDQQHRRIIEAIRRGRLDGENVSEAPPERAEKGAPTASKVSPAAAAASKAILSAPAEPLPGGPPQTPPKRKTATMPAARLSSSSARKVQPPSSTGPAPPHAASSASAAPSAPTPAPAAISASPPAPARAPYRPRSGIASTVRSLDQVIVDYLTSEAASEHLDLSLMSGGELISGEAVPLTVRASTSLTERPVAGAHVSIRVVSTNRAPQILFRGATGSDGLVKATCTMPDVGSASAALIVAASSPIGNNEVKQLIKRRTR